MAATVIVELSGDERKVLESYRKAEEADRKLRDSTKMTAQESAAASQSFASGWIDATKNSSASVDVLLRQLRRTGEEGKIAANAIESHFKDTGRSGKAGVDELIARLGAVDGEAGAAAAAASKAFQEQLKADQITAGLDTLLTTLRAAGPEGAEAAKRIRAEMTTAGKDSAESFQAVIDYLKATDPAAAEAARKIRFEMQQAARQAEEDLKKADERSKFDETLKSIRDLSPTGQRIAGELVKQMAAASASSVGSLDQLVDKLGELDPQAKAMAEKIKQEIAQADRATQFDHSLAELARINPAAAQAARTIRDEMNSVDADTKFDQIIASLKAIDPHAAAEAEKMRKHMGVATNQMGNQLVTGMRDAATGAVNELSPIAGEITGMGTLFEAIAKPAGGVGLLLAGIHSIGQAVSENHKALVATRDLAVSVAATQQEVSANLVGMSIVDQNEVLSKRLPQLAAELGVEDLAGLKSAYGAAYSASGGDAQAAERAVTAASQLSSANAGSIRANAGAALDLSRATGDQSAERNLSLLGSAMAVARVDDPAAFAKTLSKAVSQSVQMIPEQDKTSLAVQSAAGFSTLTQFATDTTGEETKTAWIQYSKRLDELFDTLPDIGMEARDKLAKLDAAKSLTPLQEKERDQLRELVKATETTVDPKDMMKRLEIVQQTPALADKLHSTSIGGEMYEGIFKQLSYNAESAVSKELSANVGKITMDESVFNEQAKAAAAATPQLLTGRLKRGQTAAINIAELGQPGDALGIQAEENVSALLAKTRGEGSLYSTVDYFGEVFRPERLPGSTALAKLQSAPLPLLDRRQALIEQNKSIPGGDPELTAKIQALDAEIKALQETATLYVEQLKDGRVPLRPGELDESLSMAAGRMSMVGPNASGGLGADGAGELIKRQITELESLRASQAEPASESRPVVPVIQSEPKASSPVTPLDLSADQPDELGIPKKPKTREVATGLTEVIEPTGQKTSEQLAELAKLQREQVDAMKDTAAAIREQTAIVSNQTPLLGQTAANTSPQPIDYSAIQQAEAQV